MPQIELSLRTPSRSSRSFLRHSKVPVDAGAGPQIEWLGFLIDSKHQMFRVSESKLAKVREALKEMLETPTTSARKPAALAGKIVALSPAVLPAALYSRLF
jgi:hypothetical protein